MLTLNPISYTVGLPPGIDRHYSQFKEKEKMFELHYSHGAFDGRTVLKGENAPLLSGIYFNLGAQFECIWPSTNKKVTFYSNHFTLLHLPAVYSEYCVVNKGNHRSIMMNVSDELLNFWCCGYTGQQFAHLENGLVENELCIYGEQPVFIEDRIIKKINALLDRLVARPEFEPGTFLDCQMLLIDCLDHLKMFGKQLSEQAKEGGTAYWDESLVTDEALDLLQRTQKYLLKNIRYKNTIEDVAHEVGAQPRYLNRLFQKHHGMNVLNWLTCERMKLAQHLVFTTTDEIGDIGKHVGYPIHKHFTSAFKRKFGYTPSELRHPLNGQNERTFINDKMEDV